jgi:hypothetical protein
MSTRILALLAGGLLFALPAVGCGGSSDGSSTGDVTASSLSKAEFIDQADAACTKRLEEARGEFLAYGEKVVNGNESGAEKEAHIATVAETIVVPELRREVEDIRALGTPKGDKSEIEAILVAIEAGTGKALANPQKAIEESAGLLEPAGRLAAAYGLKVCGTG